MRGYGNWRALEVLQTAFDLASTKTTDEGLEALAGLKELQNLDISDTRATGAGLKRASGAEGVRGRGWHT